MTEIADSPGSIVFTKDRPVSNFQREPEERGFVDGQTLPEGRISPHILAAEALGLTYSLKVPGEIDPRAIYPGTLIKEGFMSIYVKGELKDLRRYYDIKHKIEKELNE